MPFCPVCREEYRHGFTHCADCGESLVDVLDPLPNIEKIYVDDAEALLLCSITDDFKALLIEATLQDQGIPVLMRTGGAGRYFAESGGISGEHWEIYVPSYLGGEARELLNGIILNEAAAHPEIPPDEPGYVSPRRSYKASEDKRIKLSIIFGLIAAAYILYMYFATGSAGI